MPFPDAIENGRTMAQQGAGVQLRRESHRADFAAIALGRFAIAGPEDNRDRHWAVTTLPTDSFPVHTPETPGRTRARGLRTVRRLKKEVPRR